MLVRKQKRALFVLGFAAHEIEAIVEEGRERELLEILDDDEMYRQCRTDFNMIGEEFHLARRNEVIETLKWRYMRQPGEPIQKGSLVEEDTVYTDNLIKIAGL